LHRETDEPLDGVVYGAAVALGFAAVENAVFADRAESVGLVVQRAFTATLLHVCCTASVGFALAVAKLSRRRGRRRWRWIAGGIGFAVGLHGLYDLVLAGDRALALVALLLLLPFGLVALAVKIQWARSRSAVFHPEGAKRSARRPPSPRA
jgi:RsiW-degrading membrane proteinase PrsW (M82 family)